MSAVPAGFQLQEKIAALEATILSRHPTLPILLREIWVAVKAQPEQVTLLDEDQIHVIVNGLEVQTGVHLAESASKTAKKPALVASLKAKGADAF